MMVLLLVKLSAKEKTVCVCAVAASGAPAKMNVIAILRGRFFMVIWNRLTMLTLTSRAGLGWVKTAVRVGIRS